MGTLPRSCWWCLSPISPRTGSIPVEQCQNLSGTAALRRDDVALPLTAPDGELTALEADVGPLERDHLAPAQTGVAAEQHGRCRFGPWLLRALDEPVKVFGLVQG